jgi:hypothetical protein
MTRRDSGSYRACACKRVNNDRIFVRSSDNVTDHRRE